MVVIPIERVCSDYFPRLSVDKLKGKIARGEIRLPLNAIERSQKSAYQRRKPEPVDLVWPGRSKLSVSTWRYERCCGRCAREELEVSGNGEKCGVENAETKKAHLAVSLFFTAYGAGTRNRTRDLLITSQLLYHLSYTGTGASL